MASGETSSGIRYKIPEGFRLGVPEGTTAPRRSFRPGRSRSGRVRSEEPGSSEALVRTLERQDMDLEELTISPGRRRGARPTDRTVELDVPLDPEVDAAVLVERDGVYSWHFAEPAAAPGPRRGARPTRSADRRTAVFRFDFDDTGASPGRRGLGRDFLFGVAKAYVLKFAARLAVGGAMAFLERNVRPGVVCLQGMDLDSWTKGDGVAGFVPPAGRPARILLLIHGTFSSTVGSFGALAGFDKGRRFLGRALGAYDLVAGFDHRTLAEDPVDNAIRILNHLEAVDWPHPPRFDAVSYSRGGLVFRSLVEHLLHASRFAGRLERSVFVGCTNGGTHLATPENWNEMIDLYTNLAVAAARVGRLFPQTAPVAVAFEEIVEGLGPFIKYAAGHAADARSVPGVAAMVPGGPFLEELNRVQHGQPSAATARYFAVTSAFDPSSGEAPGLSEIPRHLLGRLAGGLVSQLMGRDNDLVVHTEGMTAFDPGHQGILRDSLAFDRDPRVYHTVYFAQEGVAGALERWLELDAPPASES